ncbi:late embryogenesis abundant protein At1g64065-like [Impatiens glandulifera]|uniref:late embryogenesis abundant protein At1g64065-like n=1 Tax=Impatiens glandulifera TaxID=253017 RepID=UPI001FB0F654|nr:late embryogenesis abundant protein At1g64065-like [Impatiens glandulifera]
MDIESDKLPLTPGKIHPRSNEEAFAKMMNPKYRLSRRRQQGTSGGKCFVYVFLFIVLLAAAALIFSIAVLRVERPHVKLTSISVSRLSYIAASPVYTFNASLSVLLAIDNNNFGRYRFEESRATISYDNWTIGGGRIFGDRARAREVDRFNISMDVKSVDGLSSNQNFSSELNSGTVNLNSYAELNGRVRIMKIVNKLKKTVMNCTMSLHLQTRQVHNLICF